MKKFKLTTPSKTVFFEDEEENAKALAVILSEDAFFILSEEGGLCGLAEKPKKGWYPIFMRESDECVEL